MQPSIPWSSSASVFVIERMAIIHSLKCTVSFSFVVPLLSLALTHCHLLSLVVTRCITRCHSLYHSLSLVVPVFVTRCHSLYHSVICCHSFSFVVTRCTTRCRSLYHSLSYVVTRCTTRCHSLSLVVPLVVTLCHSLSLVTRCTTRLSFYKRSEKQAWPLQLYIKETPIQVFSCEYCEIFKTAFFYRIPPAGASEC